jgi:hypothetical protein
MLFITKIKNVLKEFFHSKQDVLCHISFPSLSFCLSFCLSFFHLFSPKDLERKPFLSNLNFRRVRNWRKNTESYYFLNFFNLFGKISKKLKEIRSIFRSCQLVDHRRYSSSVTGFTWHFKIVPTDCFYLQKYQRFFELLCSESECRPKHKNKQKRQKLVALFWKKKILVNRSVLKNECFLEKPEE